MKCSKVLKHGIKLMKKCEISNIVIRDFSDIKFGFDYDVLF
jgi:hypothetical protein